MVSPDFSAVNYRPSGASNGYQTFNLYIPSGPTPSAGWPVVIYLNHSGWTTSSKAGSVTSGLRLRLIHAGLALCDATATVVDTGDPSITGGGMWWDPSDPGWATDDVPEKDLIWIAQKLRDLSSTYEIDEDSIGVYAPSPSGSTVAANVLFSQDAADAGAGTTQEQQSSRLQAAALTQPLGYYGGVQTSYNPVRLRDSSSTSTQAATLANATAAHRLQASPLYRAASSQSLGTDNGDIPIYLRSVGVPDSYEFGLSASGVPTLTNTITDDSDTWHQVLVRKYLQRDVGPVRQHRKTRHSANVDLQAYGVDFNLDAGDEHELYAQRFLTTALKPQGGVTTFDIPCPAWTVGMTTTRRAVSTGPDAALYARRQVRSGAARSTGQAKRREWQLSWPNATASDVNALELFAVGAHGNVLPMNFAPPDEPGSTRVRIVGNSFRVVQENATRFSMSLALEEVP